MKHRLASIFRFILIVVMLAGIVAQPQSPALATGSLTIAPLTWNVIGLDSNNVDVGPNHFPIGARVCNTSGTNSPSVTVTFNFAAGNLGASNYTGDSYINLRAGTLEVVSLSIPAGQCKDAYFEAEVTRSSSAYNKTRVYTITANDGGGGTATTPANRELFVEHLVSQSRNSVSDMQLSTDGSSFSSIGVGGTMTLTVGETYWIKLVGSTATNGYEQIESFINFPNTIFQMLSVSTTASVAYPDTSKLYADACTWINANNSPNYRSCASTGKAGGNITVTYQVKILTVPGAPLVNPEPLSTLIYDFSGSSYHYNADFSTSVRFAKIVSPATIAKSFSPNTIAAGGTSTLTYTIKSISSNSLSNLNFADTTGTPGWPTGLNVSNTTVTYGGTTGSSSCGSPSATLTAGSPGASFSSITVAAGATCTIAITVTSATDGTYPNTTKNLFIDTLDTGSKANDTLSVSSVPTMTGYTCGTAKDTLVTWNFNAGDGGTATNPGYTGSLGTGVTSATATASGGTASLNEPTTQPPAADESTSGLNYWKILGGWETITTTPTHTNTPYFEFTVDTSNYSEVEIRLSDNPQANWASGGSANQIYVHTYNGTTWVDMPSTGIITTKGKWNYYTDPGVVHTATGAATGTSTTTFRINALGAATSAAYLLLDDVTILGCPRPTPPTLAKTFSPSTIGSDATDPTVNTTINYTTLTFRVDNPNASILTGVAFNDPLPTGLVVANPPTVSTPSCTSGTLTGQTITATAGSNTISMSGGSLSTSATNCTFSVRVQGMAAGSYTNTTNRIKAAYAGTNTTGGADVGYGTDPLTVVDAPVISKVFGANSILTGNSTSLTFTMTNPNPSLALTGVNFVGGDSLPSGLVVASPNGLTSVTCSTGTLTGQTITATATTSSVTMTGGTLSAGATCSFSVNVTGTTAGLKTNTVQLGSTEGGNSKISTAKILVKDATPALALKKQVGASSSGPWYDYLLIPAGNPVWYKFTVENTGDLAFDSVTITDNTFSPSCTWSPTTTPLPVAVAGNNNHISTCIVQNGTAASGVVTNTASATGLIGGSPTTSPNDTAKYENGSPMPLPVTVAYFRAQRQGSSVDFEWSTSTEAGNLGFNLYAENDGQLIKLNGELISSQVFDSLERQDYTFSADTAGNTFYIEDISILGETRQHGPFQLGEPYGEKLDNEKIDQTAVSNEHAAKFAEDQAAIKRDMKVPAAALLPEVSGGNELQQTNPLNLKVTQQLTTSLNLKVNKTGIYRVTYEMLKNAGLDLSGVPLRKVTLTNQGHQVPIYVEGKAKFGPGAFIEFYGEALDTLYTGTNVYTIQVSKSPAERMAVNNARPGNGLPVPASFTDTLTVNRQQKYVFSSPSASQDPWYDTALLTGTAPKSWEFPFELKGLANSSDPAALELVVWGATIYAQNPDHHLVVRVNGVPVADQTFDGNMEKIIKVAIPAGVLKESGNSLQLTLPGDTGAPADLIYLDRYSVSYPRLYQAQNDQLRFTADGKAFTVTNLPTKNVLVYRLGENGPERLGQAKVSPSGNTFTVTFAGTNKPTTYFVTTAENLYTPTTEAVRLKADLNSPAQFLIISHPDFIGGLDSLVQARRAQGLTVSVVDVNDVYAQYSYSVFDPQAIKNYIAYASSSLGTQYVLLVGGDTYDYRNYLGSNGISFIPSLYAPTIGVIKTAPLDPLYTDLNDDGTPDLAIGRFPVRSTAQLNLMVQKTLAYGQKDYGRTSVFATDKKDGPLSFKAISSAMTANMPAGWSVENVNLDDLNAALAKQLLLAAMNRGTALVTYTGHSGASEWTASKLFNTTDAANLTNAGRPFVVAQWGCWNTYYVHPTNNYLVQSLLFSGDKGAAAVLGAATLTNSESENLLGVLLTPRMVAPGMTIGQALQDAKNELALTHPELRDVLLGWTLMGDPTLMIQP